MEASDQVRAMGLAVGDTIRGIEDYGDGEWNEAELTLLWVGDEIAVWRERGRSRLTPDWVDHGESASWTLDCRQWHKVATHPKD